MVINFLYIFLSQILLIHASIPNWDVDNLSVDLFSSSSTKSTYSYCLYNENGYNLTKKITKNADGTLTSAGKDHYVRNERHKDLKNRRNLSDDELRRKIQRLKLENEYKRLSEQDIKPGKTFCSNFLNKYGSTVLTTLATGATYYFIKAAMTKNFSINDAADYIVPKPGKKKG